MLVLYPQFKSIMVHYPKVAKLKVKIVELKGLVS